jgi:hypothetical protein
MIHSLHFTETSFFPDHYVQQSRTDDQVRERAPWRDVALVHILLNRHYYNNERLHQGGEIRDIRLNISPAKSL